jgi:hypothetical protein
MIDGRMPFPFMLGKTDEKFFPCQSPGKRSGLNCCLVNSIDFYGTCSSMILRILQVHDAANFKDRFMSLTGVT